MSPQTRRSIWAVFAGFLAGAALTLATDEILHLAGVFPPWGASMVGYDSALLLATAYRIIFGVLGCYLAAGLAPDLPMHHALWLGLIGVAVGTLGAVVTWNKGPAFGPHWYPVAHVVLALPEAWLGGKLREKQLRVTA